MMPLWLFTLGKTLTDKAQLKIPFMRLISNLLFTIVPCNIFEKFKHLICLYLKY